ncbi:MAG: hypothetical protein OEW78_04405 [Nitrosopumilus sp.]|uniref:hypothetical protein n=1 Tax=Nitrosopumilus sp. TaxID=2024843 RepID=UPI0024725426|nr:hypothetical protein [Nitrosopumilus sp.]MDH5431108.1 hypothetical protein [Nitrosopumilus sp.]
MKKQNTLYIGIPDETKEFLENRSRIEGISTTEYVRKIITKYQKIYSRLEDERSHITPKEVVKALYQEINNDKGREKVIATIQEYGEYYLRCDSDDFSFKRVLRSIENWFEIRGLKLESKEKNKIIRMTCKHDLGINWSKIIMQVTINLLMSAGCTDPKILTKSDTYFQFDITPPIE